jgi:streptomycin 6-kinase
MTTITEPWWVRAISGGSGAQLIFDQSEVFKTSQGDVKKLLAEGRWLRWVGSQRRVPELRQHVPAVRALPSAARPVLVLERVSGIAARTAVIASGDPRVLPLAMRAVAMAFDGLPALGTRRPGWATGSWCADHLRTSLKHATSTHRWVADALAARGVVLADALFPNPLRDAGHAVVRLLRTFRPPMTCVLHGDLHLGNIMVDLDRDHFHLLDPRGGWNGNFTFDPAYDVAKLLHEPHYAAVRASLLRLELTTEADAVILRLASGDWPSAASPAHEPLRRLAHASRALATAACSNLGNDDPLLAARATLLTGVLLLSILRLPHTVDYQVQTLFGHGITWLLAGVHALSHGYGLGRCQRLWDDLLAQVCPDGWAATAVGISRDLS